LLKNEAFKELSRYHTSIALVLLQTLVAGHIVCYESWSTAPGFSHALVVITSDIFPRLILKPYAYIYTLHIGTYFLSCTALISKH